MRDTGAAAAGATATTQEQVREVLDWFDRFVTDATVTAGGQTTSMRSGDLLVRTAEGWSFQTMVAGGWHEHL